MSAHSGPGFTLIELAVVLVIAGMLAWIAYPQFAAYHEIKLDAAARRVASDLRYAQNRTIGRRTVHGVLFEPTLNRYTVFAPTAATPVADPVERDHPLRVDFTTRAEYQGVTIVSASFGSTPGVRFDYFGVPRDTAGTELAATGRVVLAYHGALDTVEVEPLTGTVVVR